MASKKAAKGLSQAERRRALVKAKRQREREKEKKKRQREREREKARKAKEREKLKLQTDLRRARNAKKDAARQRQAALKRKVGAAQQERLLRAADVKLEAALDKLRRLETALGIKKTRHGTFVKTAAAVDLPRQPTRQQQQFDDYEAREEIEEATISSREEIGIVDTVRLYNELIQSGEIERSSHGTEFDLDTSPRGVVMQSAVPVGELLEERNIEDILHRARAAVQEAMAWNKHVYAVVHMYQSEPTYDKRKDDGKAGGKPDGKIWKDPTNKENTLWSTWQGVKATTADAVLGSLETRLAEIIRANGNKNIAIVHEVIIRSVAADEIKK